MVTDNGTEFVNGHFRKLCQEWGIEHRTTTVGHPQANGMIERAHRRLEDALRCRQVVDQWPSNLPKVMFSLHATRREEARYSPAQMLFGEQIGAAGQGFEEVAGSEDAVAEAVRRWPTNLRTEETKFHGHPKVTGMDRLTGASWVLQRRVTWDHSLADKYSGPYKVLRKTEKVWTIEKDSRPVPVSVDNLIRFVPSQEREERVDTTEEYLPERSTNPQWWREVEPPNIGEWRKVIVGTRDEEEDEYVEEDVDEEGDVDEEEDIDEEEDGDEEEDDDKEEDEDEEEDVEEEEASASENVQGNEGATTTLEEQTDEQEEDQKRSAETEQTGSSSTAQIPTTNQRDDELTSYDGVRRSGRNRRTPRRQDFVYEGD